MFMIQKNLRRRNKLDYEAMARQARQERAQYLGRLYERWLLRVGQFLKRQLGRVDISNLDIISHLQ